MNKAMCTYKITMKTPGGLKNEVSFEYNNIANRQASQLL